MCEHCPLLMAIIFESHNDLHTKYLNGLFLLVMLALV